MAWEICSAHRRRRVCRLPHRGLHRSVAAGAERGHDDGNQAKGPAAFGAGAVPECACVVWWLPELSSSADANEFVASTTKFNEYLMMLKILTSSKPETSLI